VHYFTKLEISTKATFSIIKPHLGRLGIAGHKNIRAAISTRAALPISDTGDIRFQPFHKAANMKISLFVHIDLDGHRTNNITTTL
jgi:hypothetical protein